MLSLAAASRSPPFNCVSAGFSAAPPPCGSETPKPWPTGAGFAQDPSFPTGCTPGVNCAPGTSGWDTSYLWLNESANVKFQFMGGGDSAQSNLFGVDLNGNGVWDPGETLFQDPPSTSPTDPCPVTPLGATAPTCDKIAPGPVPDPGLTYNQYTIPITVALGGGYVPFWFFAGSPTSVTVENDGLGNLDDDSGEPGYMLGADPYLASKPFSCLEANGESCTAVYASLSDRSRVSLFQYEMSLKADRISNEE
jgi:hypothetical protein